MLIEGRPCCYFRQSLSRLYSNLIENPLESLGGRIAPRAPWGRMVQVQIHGLAVRYRSIARLTFNHDIWARWEDNRGQKDSKSVAVSYQGDWSDCRANKNILCDTLYDVHTDTKWWHDQLETEGQPYEERWERNSSVGYWEQLWGFIRYWACIVQHKNQSEDECSVCDCRLGFLLLSWARLQQKRWVQSKGSHKATP